MNHTFLISDFRLQGLLCWLKIDSLNLLMILLFKLHCKLEEGTWNKEIHFHDAVTPAIKMTHSEVPIMRNVATLQKETLISNGMVINNSIRLDLMAYYNKAPSFACSVRLSLPCNSVPLVLEVNIIISLTLVIPDLPPWSKC